jgi:hypothetical protein
MVTLQSVYLKLKSNGTAYRINIPHQVFASHYPPDILDSISRKSIRLNKEFL